MYSEDKSVKPTESINKRTRFVVKWNNTVGGTETAYVPVMRSNPINNIMRRFEEFLQPEVLSGGRAGDIVIRLDVDRSGNVLV